MRVVLIGALLAVSCGRTGSMEPPMGAQAPLFVFKGRLCPTVGVEDDLTPQKSDSMALVEMTAQDECSNAGGHWLIGRELGSTTDYFVGEHACSFHPAALQLKPARYFAVVRYSATAALFHTPTGWCLTNANESQPVATSAQSIAWGVFQTEAGARAAYERLKSQR